MEPYTSRHAGVISAIRAIAWLVSIKSKRAKHSIGGVDWSSHIGEGWPPRSQSSGVLTLRCRYLSHPRERSESIGYSLPVFIKHPRLSLSLRDTYVKSACSFSSRADHLCDRFRTRMRRTSMRALHGRRRRWYCRHYGVHTVSTSTAKKQRCVLDEQFRILEQ